MYDVPTTTCSVNYWSMPTVRIVKELKPINFIYATCAALSVDYDALLSPKKTNELVRARHICMYLIKKNIKISLVKIGKLFHRDHTTVMYALSCVKDELSLAHLRDKMQDDILKVMQFLN